MTIYAQNACICFSLSAVIFIVMHLAHSAGISIFLSFFFQPSSKKFFEDFCSALESSEVEFMRQVFNDRSVLFLGCDPVRTEYKNFFQKFAVNAKVMHMTLAILNPLFC